LEKPSLDATTTKACPIKPQQWDHYSRGAFQLLMIYLIIGHNFKLPGLYEYKKPRLITVVTYTFLIHLQLSHPQKITFSRFLFA